MTTATPRRRRRPSRTDSADAPAAHDRILQAAPLASADPEQIIARVAPTVQAHLTRP